MKIAVTSAGKELSDSVFELFGRCPYFIIAEVENGKIIKTEALKNESENQSIGAGVSAAKLLAENNVNAVIAGSTGPKAMDVMNQFGIKVYRGEGTVGEALQKFVDKNLEKTN
jgi:predicted Fe-Mo cluster-binding NifX family protein